MWFMYSVYSMSNGVGMETGYEKHDTCKNLAEYGVKQSQDCTVDYSCHKLAVLSELGRSNFQQTSKHQLSTMFFGLKWIYGLDL